MDQIVMAPSSSGISGLRYLPPRWNIVLEVLTSSNASNRLLLYLLHQLSVNAVTLSDFGIKEANAGEEVEFLSRLESIALFASIAERYGMPFDLDQQAAAFLANRDAFDLVEDQGIRVDREDLPWVMSIISLDLRLVQTFDWPENPLSIELLSLIASRCRSWFVKMVGVRIAAHGRHGTLVAKDVEDFMRRTLLNSYMVHTEALEDGDGEEKANDLVRSLLRA